MNPFDIVIVTNSAGELSAYVKPTVSELSAQFPGSRIFLVLTPCQYATGRELEEAKSFKEIYEIIIPQEYKRWIIKNKPPTGIKFNEKGLVIYMGGDLLHAVLISKRLKYPAIAYSQKSVQWKNFFRAFLVPDERTKELLLRKNVLPEKVKIVGDLMVDSVPEGIDPAQAAERWKLNPNQTVISFLPGSRPFQTDYMLPFFLETSKIIRKIMPDVQFLMILSPYITEEEIKRSLKGDGTIYSQGDLKYIQTKDGTRIQIVNSLRHEAISISKIVLTIPGTNTAEIGALGVPMIVIFPLDRPESIPLEGLSELFCRIPVAGGFLKRLAIGLASLRIKYFALPNIRADKEIVPEFRGRVLAKEVAAKAVHCLKDADWLKETGEELKRVMGGRGAAENIAGVVKDLMEAVQ